MSILELSNNRISIQIIFIHRREATLSMVCPSICGLSKSYNGMPKVIFLEFKLEVTEYTLGISIFFLFLNLFTLL